MQRMDAVFVGVWMTGMIIKLACDLYACRVCFASLAGKRRPKTALFLTGGAILALAVWASMSPAAQKVLLDTGLLFAATAVIGGVLPLILWMIGRLRKGGR